jgi:hypothetical protein
VYRPIFLKSEVFCGLKATSPRDLAVEIFICLMTYVVAFRKLGLQTVNKSTVVL